MARFRRRKPLCTLNTSVGPVNTFKYRKTWKLKKTHTHLGPKRRISRRLDPFPLSPTSTYLGNITGLGTCDRSRVWVRGVRVGVAKLRPSTNPYPQDRLTGFRGFFHGFSHSYFFTKNNFISLYNIFFFCNNLYTIRFGFSFRMQQFYFHEERVKINKVMIQLFDIDYFRKCHVTLHMR